MAKKKLNKDTKSEGAKIETPVVEEISFELQMKKIVEDLQKEVRELKASNTPVSPTTTAKAPTENEKYDAALYDDFLETPVYFYTFNSYRRMSSEKRRGKIVSLPVGEAIVFENVIRKKARSGRGETVISVSRCKVESKSNVEWLRSHKDYGLTFYENIHNAKNEDAMLAHEMSRLSNSVSSMSDIQVISAAKSRNLALNSDISQLRRDLVKSMAETSNKQSKARMQTVAERTHPDNNRGENAKNITKGTSGGSVGTY